MTDDELTKEAFTRIANDFCDKWPQMGPSARWLNLVNLFTSAAEKARAAGYEEAREKIHALILHGKPANVTRSYLARQIRSMKPEASPSAQGEGK